MDRERNGSVEQVDDVLIIGCDYKNKEVENREEQIKFIDEANFKIWQLRGAPQSEFDAIIIGIDALEKSKALNYTFGIAQGTLNLGMGTFILNNDFALAVQQMNEALNLFKSLDDKKWTSNTLLTLALIYNTSGKTDDALYYALRGISYFENNDEEVYDKIMAYYIVGTIYSDLKKYDEAEKNYKLGIADPAKSVKTWSGRIYIGLASVYSVQEKYDEAISMNLKGLEILKKEMNLIGESRALNDLGIIYKKQKKYDKALTFLLEALEIRENHRIIRFAVSSFIDLAALHTEMLEYDKALDYLVKAEKTAIEINLRVKLAHVYQDAGDIYKLKNDFKQALFYYEKLLKLNEELYKKDTETKIKNLTDELLREKEVEIERIKNVELKSAYDIIELKNKEILDSINYAKRIQYVLLANNELLNANLPEHFVLFKPKDIVSGDFYWATKKDNNFYLAVCDSTGHGVPGAFMSLLNMSFLNEAINEKNILQPNKILDHVRTKLISHMDGGRDGMDAILVCFNEESNVLTYSAANNMPLVIRDNKIIELPFDKMPVGKGEKEDNFNYHTFDLKKGDTLYLYTDGYADQFGGPNGKKFKYKSLNEMLLANSNEIANKQSQLLDEKFFEWKGTLEQVDDVCVIGIKI
ncbi:MAG: tetratricopeptide repeat protein [Bacteroidetes bacterium]|nr:tetratricopeptide repeat protein [Bacteroidota bacterium]